MTYLVFGTSSIRFFSGFGASKFFLIPKSIPTKLSVLGNTSRKTSTTKLRKYRLAESLITVTDDGIAVSSLDHTIFSFPIFAYENIHHL